MHGLAQRIRPRAGWADLILPEAALLSLREIAAHVRARAKVHPDWQQAGAGPGHGSNVTALFTGPHGIGKALAAEVLAGDLGVDLYRIDRARVVSEYIGETEKNLRAIFDAAEATGAVLLFDEADALLGSRTEVKDSHDRYANMEAGSVPQRMESFAGVVILASSSREVIDATLLRRFRFVVEFPPPRSR